MATVTGSASTDIDAPLEAVWAIVQDVEQWAEWQGTIGDVKTVANDGEGRVASCKAQIDAKVLTIKLELDCTYEPPARMTFTRTHGDLSALEGSWTLEAIDDAHTRATYELSVEPGGVIGFLLNDSTTARLREILINARPGELQARAAGT